jgi:capsid portal protein
MPASSNAQLNAWADTRSRTIADKITQIRAIIDAYLTDYAAQGIAAAITADGASNTMGTQDSRAAITGTQIINQRAALLQVQTAINTTLVSGVGATVAAINDAIQVNGSAR